METNKKSLAVMKDIGSRIKKIRTDNNYTQVAFAEYLDTKHSVISRWEAGKIKPNTERLEKIARLGGVTVNWLLYGVDDFMPPIPVYSPIQVAFNELDAPLFHVPYSSIKELADLSTNEEYFFIMGLPLLEKHKKLLAIIGKHNADKTNSNSVLDAIKKEYVFDDTFHLFFGLRPLDSNQLDFYYPIKLHKKFTNYNEIIESLIMDETDFPYYHQPGFSISVAYKGILFVSVDSFKFTLKNFPVSAIDTLHIGNELLEEKDFKEQNLADTYQNNKALFYREMPLEITTDKFLTFDIYKNFHSHFANSRVLFGAFLESEIKEC